MSSNSILVLALEACQAVKSEEFCYAWIGESFKEQGVAPWHLKELAKQNLIIRVDGSRGGHRAYYRLNPARVALASPVTT
jgi:hypothetical protein